MMKIAILACMISASLAATVVDPSACSSYPCTIFQDDFDFLDLDVWEPEITLAGGGNWEFQGYNNNRSTSYTRDGILYIKPQLTSDIYGEAFLSSGTLSIWGINDRGEVCTGNAYYGCERVGSATNLINPIMSARLRTAQDFGVKYGRIEITAKMPSGDWLWPAIWMMPQRFKYGLWPASGEIDIIESRGNDNFGTMGNEYAGSTLHWGPYFEQNQYMRTTSGYTTGSGERFSDTFHTWRVEWSADTLVMYLDDVEVLTVDPVTNFWDFGQLDSVGDIDNPWSEGDKMAPFDQKFFFILNVAVGGTNGYFPDGVDPSKPWLNTSPTGPLDFWNARGSWLPTWQDPDGKISENAALQVDSIIVTKLAAD